MCLRMYRGATAFQPSLPYRLASATFAAEAFFAHVCLPHTQGGAYRWQQPTSMGWANVVCFSSQTLSWPWKR